LFRLPAAKTTILGKFGGSGTELLLPIRVKFGVL